jgi:hypothetical protein
MKTRPSSPLFKQIRTVLVNSVIFCALVMTGCATGILSPIHGDSAVQVVIKTDPPGAKISLNGKPLGTSPVTFRDQSGSQETFTVEIEKDGYEPMTRIVTRKWDTAHLTNRLDPIYYYSLNLLPGAQESLTASAKSMVKPSIPPLPSKQSDVDAIPVARRPAKERDAVALVIGISHYRDESIPRVRYARHDAEIMASYLEAVGGISRSRMKVLVDEGATQSDLASYIEEWLPRRVSADTTVYVYYAGHGMPNLTSGKAFLVPYDGHPDFSNKLYPLDRLYENLEKLPSKEVVVMLDSCFSGATGRSVLPSGSRPIGLAVEGVASNIKKAIVLTASSGTQISSDYDDQGHGLFTYFLLKGLRGDADKDSNGVVQVEELYNYAKTSVTKVASEAMNRDQTPLLLPITESLGTKGKIPMTISLK